MSTILSEGIGYFVLLGVGFLMASCTFLVKAETKLLETKKTTKWFSGRNIKTALIAVITIS